MTNRVIALALVWIMIAAPLYAETRSSYNRNGSMVFYDDGQGDTLLALAPESFRDEFTSESLLTDLWATSADGGGTAVVSGAQVFTLTTEAVSTSKVEGASSLSFYGSKSPSVEFRARMTNTNLGAMFIGLSDARNEAANTLSFSLSGTTLTSTATDAVGFLWDDAATTATVKCVSVNNNSDGTVIDSGVSLNNPLWKTYRIDIDSSGNASYYINNMHVCTEALAVRTTVPLAGVVGVKADSGAAAEVTVDRIYIWQRH